MQQLFPQVAGCNGNSGCTACRDCCVYQGCYLGLGQDHHKLIKEYWFLPTFCWALLWRLILHVLSFLHLLPNLMVMGECIWECFGDLEARQCVCLMRAAAVLSESEDTEVQTVQKIFHLWSADCSDSLCVCLSWTLMKWIFGSVIWVTQSSKEHAVLTLWD